MIKGEIWWADLPMPIGSVPGKRRPVLILQNDLINKSNISTVIIASITTNLELAKANGNLLLEVGDSKLSKTSVVNFSQILTVNKDWLTECVGMLNKSIMKQINVKLKLVLDIE